MRMAKRIPRASRPYMPGYEMMFGKDRGLIPWSWAARHLAKAHNYFLVTTRPDQRPHSMPVWGIWLDDAFFFSTGRSSRKARNLAANPRCVVCPEHAEEAVILEGTVEEVKDRVVLKRFAAAYKKKYDWDMEKTEEPVYIVRPSVIFGFIEKADQPTGNPTRWVFE